jgi:beta-xylosidase
MSVHYQNPLMYDNFPDPGVMKVGTRYYAFATNGAGGNVQAAGSRDLVRVPLRRSGAKYICIAIVSLDLMQRCCKGLAEDLPT